MNSLGDKRIGVEIEQEVATVTLRREDRHNAFDDEMIGSFVRALERLGQSEPRAVVLVGAGERSFCSGYDINGIDPDQSLENPLPDDRFEKAVLAVTQFDAPVVAALNGSAFGGGLDLALACDFRVGHPDVEVAMTPCRLGLVYSVTGISRFVRRLGSQTTRRLFLTGRPLGAEEARRLFIIDEIVDPAEVLLHSQKLARSIANLAPLAVRGTRRTIQFVENTMFDCPDIPAELGQRRLDAFTSDDLRLGLQSFRDQRKPLFGGK